MINSKFNKNIFIFYFILPLFLLFVFIYIIKQNEKQNNLFLSSSKNNVQENCLSKTENLEVRGSSLAPLVNSGQTVKLLYGYYQCHPIEREDIIVYKYAGNAAPIIKIVKGLEGDKFQLQKSEIGCWNVLVNDKTLQNSVGERYCFNENAYKMLSLYERDYKGVIPKNAYLILGNITNGSLDSSHFGLVDKSDILGKAGL